jgi:hypothetical protein
MVLSPVIEDANSEGNFRFPAPREVLKKIVVSKIVKYNTYTYELNM